MKKGLSLRVSDVMSSPKLLGPHFHGDSWGRWRAVIKATFGEQMSDAEVADFRDVAQRDPPRQRVSEAVYAIGRGGGKDSAASLMATAAAVNFDPKGKLRPGEMAHVLCIAVDREQAAIVLGYIKAYFEEVPALRALVKSVDRNGVTLHNNVTIIVATNSFRSVRGRSIICAIFDECAFWRSEDSAAIPDVEVAAAVAPGLARMPGSMLILISTVHKRAGLLYQRFKDHFGRDSADTLVVRGTTMQFNPTFDAKIIDRQLAEDSQRYSAEYLSEWRDDLSNYITRDLIEAAVDVGVAVRPHDPLHRYTSFVDASSGGPDSFTCAVAHKEGDVAILDCVVEVRPPFSAATATTDIAAVLKSYRLVETMGDHHARAWVVAEFARHGITFNARPSGMDRSALYLETASLFSAGRVRLIDNKRLVAQYAALERRVMPGGKDRVDHPDRAGHHDDISNSCAGALWRASAEPGGICALFSANPARAAAVIAQSAAHPHTFWDTCRAGRLREAPDWGPRTYGERAWAQMQRRRGY